MSFNPGESQFFVLFSGSREKSGLVLQVVKSYIDLNLMALGE